LFSLGGRLKVIDQLEKRLVDNGIIP
jgi:hypothetical protein